MKDPNEIGVKLMEKDSLPKAVKSMNLLRQNEENPTDITLNEYLEMGDLEVKSVTDLYEALGIEPAYDSINLILGQSDVAYRFVVPEIIREAMRLGLRKAPIWPNLIAAEETVKGLTVVMPWWNMSDATPEWVGPAETIGTGGISLDQKEVKLRKLGKGIRIPYEVKNYVSVNLVSIFLQDFGIKLGQGLDTLLIDVLINGEQANGSESAPVVGVDAVGQVQYRDFLRVWIRMAEIGRSPDTIIANADMALDTLDLPEFKNRNTGTPDHNLKLKTPVPTQTNYYIHSGVPADQSLIVDSKASILKLNAQPLLVETDKTISNQTYDSYATLTTGYCVLYRDARVIVDQSEDILVQTFPSYMDVGSAQSVEFEG